MSRSQAKGGWKTCEHCRSNMSLFADVCPQCGRRAYGGVVGASRHAKHVAEANDPGITERIKAQKRDRDKTHAYCGTCHRRVYSGEVGCEAGHRLSSDWEEKFKAKARVSPEKRAGGPHPELARHKPAQSGPSPHDGWLNDIAEAVAGLGLTEVGRNLDKRMGGAPVEGQLKLEGENLLLFVTLFGSEEDARKGEIGIRANPKVRKAIADGFTSLTTIELGQYLANGRGKLLDETRVSELIQVIQGHAVPRPASAAERPAPAAPGAEPLTAREAQPIASSDQIFEQIKKLGELHSAGLLTDDEFEAKKSELLARI